MSTLIRTEGVLSAVCADRRLGTRLLSRPMFATGYTRTPEGVVQLVQESIESLRLNGGHGGHGCTGRCVPARVVQHGRQVFGHRAIEVYDDVLTHIMTLREPGAACRVGDTARPWPSTRSGVLLRTGTGREGCAQHEHGGSVGRRPAVSRAAHRPLPRQPASQAQPRLGHGRFHTGLRAEVAPADRRLRGRKAVRKTSLRC
jgi:hypothetical protein